MFAPMPTGMGSFSGRFTRDGQERDEPPPFPQSLLDTGRRHLAERRLSTLREGPMVGAHPSGRVTRAAYEQLRDQILDALKAALPLDIAAFHLHGAMIAEGYDDCEGDLLAHARMIAGPDCAIGAMLDPHAHMSPAMVRSADILIAYKEYPHVDFRERAEEIWAVLLATAAGAIKPVSALWDSGVIGIFHSATPAVRTLIDRMQAMEMRDGVVSASLIHSFPWGDCRDFGTRALVVCDADPALADDLARQIAVQARMIACDSPPASALTVGEALAHIAARGPALRPYVLADSADNPGGGAAGDSTFVLAELIERGVDKACLGPLWDPQAVAIAFDAGMGARLPLRIGGKTGPLSGPPVDVDAQVIGLSEAATQQFAGEAFPLGRAAAIRVGGIDILLVTQRDQARGPDMFCGTGIELDGKSLVIVKSSQHFYDGFAPIAEEILYLKSPGSLQTDLGTYAYRHIARPRWPIDREAPAAYRVPLAG